jgi:hypothetical protein
VEAGCSPGSMRFEDNILMVASRCEAVTGADAHSGAFGTGSRSKPAGVHAANRHPDTLQTGTASRPKPADDRARCLGATLRRPATTMRQFAPGCDHRPRDRRWAACASGGRDARIGASNPRSCRAIVSRCALTGRARIEAIAIAVDDLDLGCSLKQSAMLGGQSRALGAAAG